MNTDHTPGISPRALFYGLLFSLPFWLVVGLVVYVVWLR